MRIPQTMSSSRCGRIVRAFRQAIALQPVRSSSQNGCACLRASDLGKKYGWGIHYNEDGRVAVYGRETDAYQAFADAGELKVLKAMRSSRG